ncbi:Flagellar hook-basal body complex protein FliE [Desulfamplus magnetovallimortis]|uniref:Flagellar hook-basal body complex protein FliE n=1 Tax=Desulfamplus magnetovallimortis TaxID=1246637 RepID=A0A1W1HA11_9BACT|nr:flagellar hook-basal body complex protein FliE [Desulfamplus magnetovallimortis]SLM29262.1 Flagellar hook-basal body complex protein FliE [Desulfamplus magnetovallimortis]
MITIDSIEAISPIQYTGKPSLKTEHISDRVLRRDPSFSERLNAAVKDVNSKQHIADDAIEGVIKGEVGIHEGMQAISKADSSLKLLNAVRSKAMAAYKEISSMSF